jgi:prefoldin subunit 2
MVLETLNAVKDKTTRRCFRMVGTVLVSQTVEEVMPKLETNMSGLNTVLKTLTQDFQKTEEEMRKWQTKHKVQIVQQ